MSDRIQVDQTDRCRVTVLTPPGRGAIATVSVRGRQAAALVSAAFTAAARKAIDEYPVGRILFGRWKHSLSTVADEEVVVARTREDQVDVHCHGGNAAVSSIVETLVSLGAEPFEPRDWLRESYPDPLECDALACLARVETERAAGILLDQFRGALRRELDSLCEVIINDRLEEARSRLQVLLEAGRIGVKLTSPWRVVMAGPPNVGKSSLVNALLGFRRSIVFEQAGTTRDRLETRSVLEGWPLVLIDTAGLRESAEDVESAGISLAYDAARTADVVIWVREATAVDECREPPEFVGAMATIRVANKSDLARSGSHPGWLLTSAKTGAGIGELQRAIVSRIVPDPPAAGSAVPFTWEHCRAIETALEALRANRPTEAIQSLRHV